MPGEGRVVAWSPDGKLLAYAHQSGNRLYDTATWQEVSSFPKFYLPSTVTMVWSPDSKKLAIGYAGAVQIREVLSGKLLHQFEEFKGDVVVLAWSPDGNTLVAAGRGAQQCRCYDAPSGKLLRTLEVKPGGATSAAFSPDGKTLAVGTSHDGCFVQFFETGSWKRLRQAQVNNINAVTNLTWPADGTMLAGTNYL